VLTTCPNKRLRTARFSLLSCAVRPGREISGDVFITAACTRTGSTRERGYVEDFAKAGQEQNRLSHFLCQLLKRKLATCLRRSTNVISITVADFQRTSLFNAGIRPAINAGISVNLA
jgi:hypothetical protein